VSGQINSICREDKILYKTTPLNVFLFLLKVVAVLFLLNFFVVAIRLLTGHDVVFGLIALFDMDKEGNLPTFISSVLLLIASVLLFAQGLLDKKSGHGYVYYWFLLSFIFAFLSVDEFVSLHEKLTIIVREYLEVGGVLYFAWVVPYSLLLVIFMFAFSRFLFALPGKTRKLFVFSGLIYVGGAVLIESIGGYIAENYGRAGVLYAIEYTLEETMEMIGVSLFIYSILRHMAASFGKIAVSLENGEI